MFWAEPLRSDAFSDAGNNNSTLYPAKELPKQPEWLPVKWIPLDSRGGGGGSRGGAGLADGTLRNPLRVSLPI